MKRMNLKYSGLILLAGVLVLGACKKEFNKVITDNTDPDKSYFRLYNAALSTTRNYVYVNNVQVTGAAVAYAGLFPSTGYYTAVVPGGNQILIKDTLVTSTQNPISFSAVFEKGKRYTVFTYDTLATVKYKMVFDDIVVPTDTTSRVRFANMIFSSVSIPNVDIYSTRRASNVFSNIPSTGVTPFIPYASQNDTLYVRATGTTTNLATLSNFFPTAQRSYTVIFRGRYQTTGTTGVARTLTSFSNY